MSGELVTSIANRAALSSRKRGTVKRRTQRSRHSDASESFYGKVLTTFFFTEVVPWSNVSNASGSPDSSEANATLLGFELTEYLAETAALPFVVPASAVLTGFTARIVGRSPAANIDMEVQLARGGSNTLIGAAKNASFDPAAKEFIFGDRTDLWGTGWVANDIRTNGLRLSVRAVSLGGAGDVFIDSMRLTVHYG